jgi:2-polyprenyl-6-methoxyphenol hydroxylase-like FAD-dependent oxidoreductase
MAASSETDVLVVSAGPVGLALAIELGLRSARVTLLEQYARVRNQPRAKTTNVRSMTHMRRWGIADAIRQASPLPADYPTDVLFATRLFGEPLAHIENAFYGAKRRDERFPEQAQWIPQYTVEAVLRDRAKTCPPSICASACGSRRSPKPPRGSWPSRRPRKWPQYLVQRPLSRRRRWRA